MIPESATGVQPYAPAGADFQSTLSPLQGGPKLQLESSRQPDAPGAPVVPPAAGAPPVPGGALPALPGSTGEATAARKKRPPVKIDPAILERAILNRNAPR